MVNDKYPSGAKMVKRTVRVKDEVEQILREYPQARGDDRVLAWRYYRQFSGIRISFQNFNALRRAPAFETISRRRRELQNEHPELEASERVQHKRYRREKAFIDIFTNGLKLADFETEGI